MRILLGLDRPEPCNKSARGIFPAGTFVVGVVIAATAISSCRKVAPEPAVQAQHPAMQQPMEVHVAGVEERSCQAFVQKFYDWYWNQFADKVDDPKFDSKKLHSYYDALRLNPPVLSQELTKLIEKDVAASKAAGGDIVNLDFDPFLNSNGPDGVYAVKSVGIVKGLCRAAIEGGHGTHMVTELRRNGPAWIFVNFRYSYYSEDGKTKTFPDNDLLHILNR
jgi:hypothetical protein